MTKEILTPADFMNSPAQPSHNQKNDRKEAEAQEKEMSHGEIPT